MKTFEVTQDYNREDFLEFLSDFLPEDYTQEEEQTYYDYTNIEDGYKLGTCDSLDLDVFEFRTKSERDPRVTLTREVVSFMKKYGSNQNALVVFYSDESHNWRLSLITTDYEVVNGKVKPLYSNPRRFSFRLGGECKAHTPQTMLFKKGQICEHTENGKTITPIEDLKNRFALEVVSKQFFDEYKVFYEDFVQYITGNRYVKAGGKGKYERKAVSKENTKIFNQFKKLANDDYELACKYVRDYIKKFMGRLVFLQFLQKKGWLGVAKNESWGNGNKNFLLDLFTSSNNKKDFLEKDLEPLFFGMLNTDVDDRKKLFKEKEWDVALLDEFKQIPYLNGGLFEDDALDHLEIKFPQEMFSNPAKADKERTFNDKKDYSKELYPFTESCGLLDFFARYNFTIDETDPADMEIGVEPEMLGKIFENLLEDNKDKGAFYTPKEIVQYMCRESLIAYLGDNEKIRSLVTTHVADFNDSEKTELIKKLKAVKICDPAVGSGAFPMGILNELFACRVALGENEEAAEIKKQIVRENIYGVDIEKGAVDIARLRFWLAIIVDEKEPIPLPNLDYKIMQGNSLLESYEGEDLSRLTKPSNSLFDNDEIIKQLTEAIDGFYIPSDHIAKAKIRKQISEKVIQLLKERALAPEKIKKLEKLDLHANNEFFLWHTWFGDVFNRPNGCNGFDIVIGNPPYISAPTQIANPALNMQREKIIASKNYASLYQKWDLYVPFIELGIRLNRKNGITTMIVPFPLTNQLYAKVLRKIIVTENNLFELVDLNGTKIFDNATVSNCIPFIRKSSPKEKMWISNLNDSLEIKKSFKKTFEELVQDEKAQVWNVTQEKRETNRHAEMHVLGDYCYVSKGMVLNSHEDSTDEKFKKADLISETQDDIHCRKFLEGKDCGKYVANKIRYLEYNTERVPDKCSRPTFRELYTIPKLMFNRLGELQVFYDEKGDFTTSDAMFVCLTWTSLKTVQNKSIASSIKKFSTMTRPEMEKLSETVDLKYLLGIMNSKYAPVLLTNLRGGDYHIYPEHIRNIPIPTATPAQQQEIITLVDKILAEKKANSMADTSELEQEINKLVYSLYGLTKEEIIIVERK